MRSMLRRINDHGMIYEALAFICPGCQSVDVNSTGLHMLAVFNKDKTLPIPDGKTPVWNWNGNLEKPTLTPSIMTGRGTSNICHSFLTDGYFKFLNDSTHILAGQTIPIPSLPDWFIKEGE